MKRLLSILIATLFSITPLCAQSLRKGPVEQVGDGYAFTEGPAVNKQGQVYFTDQPNDCIYIWDENKEVSLYLKGTGRANGLYFRNNGDLLSCSDQFNRLVYFDAQKQQHTLHEQYKGMHLNAPNDLWPDSKGGIYFSDPYYHRPWWPKDHKRVQDTSGVYYLSKEGTITRVVDDYVRPNGLIGTPDGKTLYIADIGADKTWKYDINEDGTLTNKTLFASKGSDGMTIDRKGNVYLTSGKVWIYNPSGKLIEEIDFPEKPANICFGGKKRRTLFVTARKGIYTCEMSTKGVD